MPLQLMKCHLCYEETYIKCKDCQNPVCKKHARQCTTCSKQSLCENCISPFKRLTENWFGQQCKNCKPLEYTPSDNNIN